jgi:hypothetical protein
LGDYYITQKNKLESTANECNKVLIAFLQLSRVIEKNSKHVHVLSESENISE